MSAVALGPAVWHNWRAWSNRRPVSVAEYRVYTDAFFDPTRSKAATAGPYVLMRTFADVDASRYAVTPSLAIRIELGAWGDASARAGDPSGEEVDGEVAALVALASGNRVESVGRMRRFREGDERGEPIERGVRRHRIGARPPSWPIVPYVPRRLDLDDVVGWLDTLPSLDAANATALVRASRSYNRGISVAEIDPELAWLELVGAVEVVADHTMTNPSPVDALREWRGGRLFDVVHNAGGMELVESVAQELHGLIGASSKFRRFLAEWLPDEPPHRPITGRLDWNPEGLSKAISTIYGHRSKRLHAGYPWPTQMLMAPGGEVGRPDAMPEEIPAGYGSAVEQSDAECAPMHLHVFEHLVRGALLRWWRSLV